MSIDERDLEAMLRSTLADWADEAPDATSERTAPARRPRRRDMRYWLTRVGPALVAAAVVAVLVVRTVPSPDATVATAPDEFVRDEIRVGDAFGVRVLALGDDALYVASENDRRLYRVDRATHAVVDGPALAVPDAVVVTDAGVVAVVDDPVRLALLDPVTLDVVDAVTLPGEPAGLQVVGDWVWVRDVDGTARRYAEDDLADGGALEGALAPGFQSAGEGVWRTDFDNAALLRLDPDTSAVLGRIPVDGEPRGVVVGDGAVWVADTANDRILRFDPDTATVEAAIAVGRFPHGLALGDDRLWVTNFEDGTLTTIDTGSNTVVATVPIGVRPGGIVAVGDELWVSIHQEGLVRVVDAQAGEARSIPAVDERVSDVDIGGRTLFLRCMGEATPGTPTVVLEAGSGQWSVHELFVQYGLQSTHRVCAYDRAGLGRSEPSPRPPLASSVVADLHALLDGAGIAPPYVLVGHADGGLYARLYAATFPDELAALVLVDAVTPTFWAEFRATLDAEDRATFDAGRADDEFAWLDESAAEVAAAGPLGDLPLVVVAGEETLGDRGDELRALWERHQRSLLTLSSDSRLVIAEGTSVFFAADAPDVVVDAVRQLSEE